MSIEIQEKEVPPTEEPAPERGEELHQELREDFARLADEINKDPSKKQVFELLRAIVIHISEDITKAASSTSHSVQLTALSHVSELLVSLRAIHHTLENNPMFDSPVLALQMKNSMEQILKLSYVGYVKIEDEVTG